MDVSKFPGFRFSPTDEELISYYLHRKIEGLEKSVEVIQEVDICNHEPWDLPDKSIIPSDHEWFFFSPTGRKYPNGSQAKRATVIGFWKATGKERNIKSGSNLIGTKRTLVFHIGRAPKGERTDWIMHEYCIKGNNVDKWQDSYVICRLRKKLDSSVKNDSPNCKSASQIGLSPANDDHHAASQVAGDMQQLQIACGEGMSMESSSKKQSSVLDSLSIDPSASSSESVQKQPIEICSPQLESEINQEDCDVKSVEDDWFADILNDDIVKLDDFSLSETPSQMPPFQGTAHRRIRLELHRPGQSHAATLEVGDGGSVVKVIRQEAKQLIKGSKSNRNRRMIFKEFVIMALLVLFLLMLTGTWGFKRFTSIKS